MNRINENRPWVTFLSNLILALLVPSQFIGIVLWKILGGSSGLFSQVMAVVILMLVMALVLERVRYVSWRLLGALGLLGVYYIFTYALMTHKTTLDPMDFCVMCIVPILCGGILRPNYETVLRYTMYVAFLGLPVFTSLFAKANTSKLYDTITMGNSYAMLPVFCAGIVHFCFFRKKATTLDKIGYGVSLLYLLFYIPKAYRGSMGALAAVVLLAILFSMEKTNKKLVWLTLLGVTLVCVFVLFGDRILTYADDLLKSMGIRIAFLEKNKVLLQAGRTLLHGREEIYLAALEGFLDAPVFGHGMAMFEYHTGYVFPHNFLLQFLFDGGLVLAVPMMYWLVSGAIRVLRQIRREDRGQFAFMILIAGLSIPRIMVSAEVWRVMLFWLLVGMVLKRSDVQEEADEEDEPEEEFYL